jgi:Putative phage serine protease XkdF
MPWTVADVDSHIKGLSPKQKRQWVHIANSSLSSCLAEGKSQTFCEGRAIRMASGSVDKRVTEDASSDIYTLVLKQEAPQRYTLGVVYEPMQEDLQGDFAKAETIQAACWEFMRRLQGRRTLTKWTASLLDAIVKSLRHTTPIRLDVTGMVDEILKAQGLLGDQHAHWDEDLGEVVECYCMPCDGVIGDAWISQGTWMLGAIWSPAYFAKIQAGERTGYSMGGKGRRRFVEDMAEAAWS